MKKTIIRSVSILGMLLVLVTALVALLRFYPYTYNFPAYPKITHTKSGAEGDPLNLVFEKPTNDVANRGHIRLWKTGTLIGGQLVWIGQASYDSRIELSGTTHLPTHHIAPTVDLERNAVGADLEKTGLVREEAYGAFTPPILYARNGGGDYYESDGDVL